jgi:precorrin-6B methylase 2
MRIAKLGILTLALAVATAPLAAQSGQKPFVPQSGQAGKDVVWVPTPMETVKAMLDMAKVTPKDFVIDLGSGDGRTVIEAAKRGARALGIEYNPDMVALSRRNAEEAGVTKLATFEQADLFASDFSKATVVTMFLLPSINMRLRPQILDMAPGTRIVTNTFTMEDWEADETVNVENCQSWCSAHLWIVPAKVDGAWSLGNSTVTISQKFQNFTGTVGSQAISNGKLRGADITFDAGGVKYAGRVSGNTIAGTMSGARTGNFTANKNK